MSRLSGTTISSNSEDRFRTRSSLPGISATGSTKSISPVLRALRGMASYSASAGSCTTVKPPFSLTRCIPRVPSLPLPDSTTATASGP